MWRYISIIVSLALISTLGWMHVYKNINEKLVFEIMKNNTINLRNAYTDIVWKKYAFMLEMSNYDISKWRESKHFIKFSSESKAFFKSSNVVQAAILTPHGDAIFSLNQYKEHECSFAHYEVYQKGFLLMQDQKDRVVVVLPITEYDHTQNKGMEAVIEITYDIQDILSNIKHAWYLLIVIFVASIGGISLWSYYKLFNSAKVLNRQYEIILKLTSAKKTAENYSLQKSQFMANISHELKTPLNSVIGFSDLICNKSAGDINSIYLDYANDINISGKHLLGFINDILDYSKSEAGKLSIAFTWFDICKVIDSCTRFVFNDMNAKNIQIVKDFFQEKIFLKADPRRMKQVIINLLSNAIKFSKNNSTIDIKIKLAKERIIIEIKDYGIGINEADLAKAMSLFGQIESSQSPEYTGTGLGLPLSQRLIELMNGEFIIESKINQGTKTVISFNYEEPILDKLD